MKRTAAPRRPPHPFVPAQHTDQRGRPMCGHNDCGQLRTAACHQLPDVDPEVIRREQERLGEREDPT